MLVQKTGSGHDHLLSKLSAEDVDMIVVDEAHIAAAEAYQRTFAHFAGARKLLMSACFKRLDGRPIEADIVYRYLLIDSIADGNAKNFRVTRFSPDASTTTYEMVYPDGQRMEIVGRDALLSIIEDERKLASITAKSEEPIRQLMREVKAALDQQAELLHPVKPRVLFSAMGERHAEQIARIATDTGIPSAHLHHSMTNSRIRSIRERFENDSGDLQGIVQLKMLGQGYDFPPIAVVVPFRPYGSFAEFYQFTGRGIRVITHPALTGRVGPGEQALDLIYHAELGLDEHVETIYEENEMDPVPVREAVGRAVEPREDIEVPGVRGAGTAERPDTFVLFERGAIDQRIVHDAERIEQRRKERENEALARSYADYASSTDNPVQHLDNYLKARVEGNVKEAARTYHRKTAERGGKPPTPKQFASTAAGPTNRWFGGDVSALYRVFGERSPVSPEYVRTIPADVESFVRHVYSALGGIEVGPYPREYDQKRMDEHSRKIAENSRKSELANMSLDYLRLEEALGRAPALKEFGKSRFAHRAEAAIGADVEEAWDRYTSVVRNALTSNKAERKLEGKIQGHEQDQPTADERFSDDEPEQALAPQVVREVPESEAKVNLQMTKKPWWRRILGN